MKDKKSLTEQMLEEYKKETNGEFEIIETNDPLVRLFNDWQVYSHWLKAKGYEKKEYYEYAEDSEKFRIKYDADARYYNETLGDPVAALRGDTVFSIFTPYKEMLKRATGKAYHKCTDPFADLIIKRNNPGYKDVNDFFTEFVKLYHTPGNFMLLPHREMNVARYRCSQDRLDKSLYECFPGGKLAIYFGMNDDAQLENIKNWVISQKMEFMFENNIIEREKIIPITKTNPYTCFGAMTDEELREYINYAVEFIKRRNEK